MLTPSELLKVKEEYENSSKSIEELLKLHKVSTLPGSELWTKSEQYAKKFWKKQEHLRRLKENQKYCTSPNAVEPPATQETSEPVKKYNHPSILEPGADEIVGATVKTVDRLAARFKDVDLSEDISLETIKQQAIALSNQITELTPLVENTRELRDLTTIFNSLYSKQLEKQEDSDETRINDLFSRLLERYADDC